MIGEFSELIRPRIYKEMHNITRKLIHLQMEELEKGDSFPHWKVNGQRYHAKRKLGDRNGYFIVKDR